MPQTGDIVKVVTKDKTYEGILMPSITEDAIVIKLSNGYNFGIKSSEAAKIK